MKLLTQLIHFKTWAVVAIISFNDIYLFCFNLLISYSFNVIPEIILSLHFFSFSSNLILFSFNQLHILVMNIFLNNLLSNKQWSTLILFTKIYWCISFHFFSILLNFLLLISKSFLFWDINLVKLSLFSFNNINWSLKISQWLILFVSLFSTYLL